MEVEMRTLLLEEMTWPEVGRALAEGYRTVVIYAGAIEQHGPHLAENADTVRGYSEGVCLAERLGHALVAPVIRPGMSEHHMGFPGSVSLRAEVFAGVVEDYIDSYIRHGFERLVLCCSHGGNSAVVEKVVAAKRQQYPEVRFATDDILARLPAMLKEAERREGLVPGTCGGHADDFETSLMLYSHPEYVDMEKAECGVVGALDEAQMARIFADGLKAISEVGILGDARGALAERGKRYLDEMMDMLEAAVRAQLAG
jgi:creatinine amidohydrolase